MAGYLDVFDGLAYVVGVVPFAVAADVGVHRFELVQSAFRFAIVADEFVALARFHLEANDFAVVVVVDVAVVAEAADSDSLDEVDYQLN